MSKAEIINIEEKKNDQRKAEMRMTSQQRIERVFQLMDLAILMSSTNESIPRQEESITWIELRLKNDFT